MMRELEDGAGHRGLAQERDRRLLPPASSASSLSQTASAMSKFAEPVSASSPGRALTLHLAERCGSPSAQRRGRDPGGIADDQQRSAIVPAQVVRRSRSKRLALNDLHPRAGRLSRHATGPRTSGTPGPRSRSARAAGPSLEQAWRNEPVPQVGSSTRGHREPIGPSGPSTAAARSARRLEITEVSSHAG